MTSSVDIQQTPGSLTIVIKPQPKGILKFGMWFFYTIPFVLLVGAIVYLFGQDSNEPVFNIQFVWIVFLLFVGTLFITKSLKKMYEKEIITVTDRSLVLTTQFLFRNTVQEFNRNEIIDLKVLGQQNFTNHPLETKNFDYLGIATAEKEVQFLIEDGKIGFQYNGMTLRFGKNIWEEDGEEIIKRIKKYWR
jgi:hypothetical protein